MIEAIDNPATLLSMHAGADVFNKRGVSVEQAVQAAKEFEAVFMAQMLKPMWEGLEADEMFGGGVGEDVFQQLMVQEYGKAVAEEGGSGLSSAIMKEMIRMQEKVDGSV